MANLLSGPDWVADSLMTENGQPNFIFNLIEDFLKSGDSQLIEQSLYVVTNCLHEQSNSIVTQLYKQSSYVLQAIYTIFDKNAVHKQLLELGSYVLTLLARYKEYSAKDNDLFVFCAKCLINCPQPELNLAGCKILVNLTNTEEDDILLKTASGNIVPKIMQHLSTYSTNYGSVAYYCRYFGNLASSNH